MNFIKSLDLKIKVVLFVGFSLIIYGVISRIVPIYFLWESISIGWFIILLGLILVCIKGIKSKNKNNVILYKIGIGLISFILLVQLILIIIIPNTDAYKVATRDIQNNQMFKEELGEIIGFGIIPTGAISIETNVNGKTGSADLNLLIKGEKAFKKVNVYVFKDYDSNWEVIEIKY